jgi:hypothetical protein
MKSLTEFYQDKDTRENVREYLLQFYKEEAVRMLMNREDAVALADATELLNKAFENMDILFSPKSEGKKIINNAR